MIIVERQNSFSSHMSDLLRFFCVQKKSVFLSVVCINKMYEEKSSERENKTKAAPPYTRGIILKSIGEETSRICFLRRVY
jgi:hypothetical protein